MCLEKQAWQGVWVLSFTVTLNAPGMAQSIILQGGEAVPGAVPILSAAGKVLLGLKLFCALGVFQLPGLNPAFPCSGKCPHGCGYAES